MFTLLDLAQLSLLAVLLCGPDSGVGDGTTPLWVHLHLGAAEMLPIESRLLPVSSLALSPHFSLTLSSPPGVAGGAECN